METSRNGGIGIRTFKSEKAHVAQQAAKEIMAIAPAGMVLGGGAVLRAHATPLRNTLMFLWSAVKCPVFTSFWDYCFSQKMY